MWDTIGNMLFNFLALIGLATMLIILALIIISRFCRVEFTIRAGEKKEDDEETSGADAEGIEDV